MSTESVNPVAQRHTVPGRVAAFFDLDHTIIATSASFAFNNEFIKSGLMTRMSLAKMAVSHLAITFTPSAIGGHEKARELAGNAVRGMTRTEVQRVISESLDEIIAPKVFAEAKELIADHRNRGHEVIVLSAGAAEMVEPVVRMLGVTRFRATEMQVDAEGRYTGTIDFYCHGQAKRQAMDELSETLGLHLPSSYAYSDSDSDIAMLGAVGHPVAVNPNRMLRREAVQRGWPILEFSNPTPLFAEPAPGSLGARIRESLVKAPEAAGQAAQKVAQKAARRARTADATRRRPR